MATSAGFSVESERAIASSYFTWLKEWPDPAERRHSDFVTLRAPRQRSRGAQPQTNQARGTASAQEFELRSPCFLAFRLLLVD